MLRIETRGTPREMGQQYGEAFREELSRCIEHYAPWLYEDNEKLASAIANIRKAVEAEAPELAEETEGMAEAAGIPLPTMLGYRFFTDVHLRIQEGCSVIFFADSDRGPLLGRNCDLSPQWDPEVQMCWIARPKTGMDTITTSYVGLVGGVGLNEAGLAMGGASAHPDQQGPGIKGLPGALLGGRLLAKCRTLKEVQAFLDGKVFRGKSFNMLVCDASGDSAIIEYASGYLPFVVRRNRETPWQACTNFFCSGRFSIAPEQEYLQSAYSRYGRIVHQLSCDQTPRTLDGMKRLLTDVAQPGLCTTGMNGVSKTAYSQISEAATGIMHLAPGHPKEVDYEEVGLG